MAWLVVGNVLIACNCDYGCPCNFNAPPSNGKCEGGWIWVIEKGDVEGVDVAGLTVALFADWPAAIHEGGGRATSYIDERADDAQRNALERLLRGELGGPWSIFINTYTLSGPDFVRFDIQQAEYDTHVRIGDVVQLDFDYIRNPVTQAEAHPEMVLPEGIVTKRAKLAASKTFRVSDALDYDHSGQYTAFGPFQYAS